MYVDLHLHVVPGLDDGASTVSESIDMINALADNGFEAAIATPHINPGLFDNNEKLLRTAIEDLVSFLAGNPHFLLYPGAEHYLDAQVVSDIERGGGLPLGGKGKTYLVEFGPDFSQQMLHAQIFRLRLKGIIPVIAHPERCYAFKDAAFAGRIVDAGALLQLDLGSISGVFGRQVRKTALKLLESGLYSVAATDLHDRNQARELHLWINTLKRIAGADITKLLLGDNPRNILEGKAHLPSPSLK